MQSRDFSAVARPAPDEISAPGVVIDKPLHAQALDPAVLSRIKAELKDVDVNNDGRYVLSISNELQKITLRGINESNDLSSFRLLF